MMNSNRCVTGFLLAMVVISSSCRDSFSPEIDDYKNNLVVDGMISNEPGPYKVSLSLSSPVNDPDYIPLSGCKVTISSLEGESEELQEEAPGVYVSSPEGIQGQVGHSYKLSVVSPEGKHYQTSFIKMPFPVGIDTVKAELQFRDNNAYAYPVGGYQFYLSTEEAADEESYFLWKLEETYEFHSQYKIHMLYRGMGLEPFFNRDSLYVCWKTQKIPQIFTGSTNDLTSGRLINEPIHYVNTETKRLQARYSLLVKQYSIPSQAYYHWKAVQEQVEGDDFLFANQPYQIMGNLKNVDDPKDRALGFFTVGAVEQERYFFDRPNADFFYTTCIANPDLMALGYMPASQYPVYLTITSEGFAFASDYCFDCTLWNGSLEKPDFWIDK